MLEEQLAQAWRERRASVEIEPTLRFCRDDLVVGANTVVGNSETLGRADDRAARRRLVALLAAAHSRLPSETSIAHVHKAALAWRSSERALAETHLALSGVGRLARPEADAQRLFLADALLSAGLEPDNLIKALGLSPAALVGKRYNPQEPRIDPGNGIESGRWTDGGAGAAAGAQLNPGRSRAPAPEGTEPRRSSAGGMAAAAVAVDAAGGALDLGALGTAAVTGLANFLALLSISGSAALAAGAGGIGLSFVPIDEPTGGWTKVPGPGDISVFRSPTVPGLTFRYTGKDGVEGEINLGPDNGGDYRDPESGQVIARWVRTAGRVGLIISTDAILGRDQEEPRLCPSPEEENHGILGRLYEDYVKSIFNPGNPTPSGFAYDFFNPQTGKFVSIDDCQQKTGELAEYKGPGYADHLAKQDVIWRVEMLPNMMLQAQRQIQASEGRPLTWFFAEKSVANVMEESFRRASLPIRVVYVPMPKVGQ